MHRNGQQAFPHETRQIVYMPVRMIVEQSVTQPQYRVIAKATCQQRFDLAPVKVRITVGIEQALLSGDGKAGAISVHRTAFENPVSLRAGHLDRKSTRLNSSH